MEATEQRDLDQYYVSEDGKTASWKLLTWEEAVAASDKGPVLVSLVRLALERKRVEELIEQNNPFWQGWMQDIGACVAAVVFVWKRDEQLGRDLRTESMEGYEASEETWDEACEKLAEYSERHALHAGPERDFRMVKFDAP